MRAHLVASFASHATRCTCGHWVNYNGVRSRYVNWYGMQFVYSWHLIFDFWTNLICLHYHFISEIHSANCPLLSDRNDPWPFIHWAWCICCGRFSLMFQCNEACKREQILHATIQRCNKQAKHFPVHYLNWCGYAKAMNYQARAISVRFSLHLLSMHA